MDNRRAPMDPGEAARRFAERLEEAQLPRFASAVRAARARVEWRPSLQMLDQVIAEFCG